MKIRKRARRDGRFDGLSVLRGTGTSQKRSRRRGPLWRWIGAMAVVLLTGVLVAGRPAAQQTGPDKIPTGVDASMVEPSGLLSEAEVEQKAPQQRELLRERYQRYLARRAQQPDPPVEPVDLEEVMPLLPAEIQESVAAVEAVQ